MTRVNAVLCVAGRRKNGRSNPRTAPEIAPLRLSASPRRIRIAIAIKMLRHAARALAGAVPRVAAVTEAAAPRLRVQEVFAGAGEPHRVLSTGVQSWSSRAYATEASKGDKGDEAEQAEGTHAEGASAADDLSLEEMKMKLDKNEEDLAEQVKQVGHVVEPATANIERSTPISVPPDGPRTDPHQ